MSRPKSSSLLSVTTVAPAGRRFGRLTVIGVAFRIGKKKSAVVCECECGRIACVGIPNLRRGITASCGCLKDETVIARSTKHGLAAVDGPLRKLYQMYRDMIGRCTNPKFRNWKDYGGRGITVCHTWLNDPVAFVKWAREHGWRPGLEIDRIDNDGGYEPANCRITNRSVNNYNRRNTAFVEAFGERKKICDWLKDPRCAVAEKKLRARLWEGMSAERAISLPLQGRPR